MVKIFVLFNLFFSCSSFAAYYVGLQNNSWQDAIPVTYLDSGNGQRVTFYALTTFSTVSLTGGYDGLYATRWRYAADISLHTGTADLLKIQGTVSPRKTITSQWVSGKINYRISKTFSLGPQLVVNSIQVPDSGRATSLGLLINSEVEMFENLRFIQTFGTMNDSGTIAYTIGIQKLF
jgi:hypothetical protein